ncbi:hypothetical protein [Haladaptatus salinisoli]|uniref:hypothetical protein n=1 Tax=Haladaptatus salinisoli TaxID=2884876 RepID=UPI001D0A02F3|nr:hypothetical protein [Haladaptatus salinisoli]
MGDTSDYVTLEQVEQLLAEQRAELTAEFEARLETKDERIAELEERLDTAEYRLDATSNIDDKLDERLEDVEETLENAKPGVDAPETTLHNTLLADTPLEQVCGMTDQESRGYLSENQHRARNIALVATKIGKKTPNGYVISNKKYREELAAMLGKYPNDNTVKRTREFLDWFGKENVQIIDHRGSKKVVFDTAYAKQLGRTSYAPEECLVVEHKNSWKDMLGLHPSGNDSAGVSATV